MCSESCLIFMETVFILLSTCGVSDVSSKSKELHIVCTSNPHGVSNALSIDALNHRSVDGPRIAALRVIGLRALGLVVVVSEYTCPLLHRLLVVLRTERGVRAAMIDLHLGSSAIVAGIHVENGVGPGLRGANGLTISAGIVPGVDSTASGDEATSSDSGVDDGSFENIWVGCSQDVLHKTLAVPSKCDQN